MLSSTTNKLHYLSRCLPLSRSQITNDEQNGNFVREIHERSDAIPTGLFISHSECYFGGFFRDLLELKSQLSVVKAEGMKDCLHIIRRRVWHQNVSHFVVSFRFLFFTVFLNLVQIHFPWSFNTVTDAFLFLFSNVLSIRLIDTTIVKFPTQCQYGVHSGVQTTSFWFTFR